MAANHEEFLLAYRNSTHRETLEACHRWMDARMNHPLYSQLSESRTLPQDKILLDIIHKDIHHLRIDYIQKMKIQMNAEYDCDLHEFV